MEAGQESTRPRRTFATGMGKKGTLSKDPVQKAFMTLVGFADKGKIRAGTGERTSKESTPIDRKRTSHRG